MSSGSKWSPAREREPSANTHSFLKHRLSMDGAHRSSPCAEGTDLHQALGARTLPSLGAVPSRPLLPVSVAQGPVVLGPRAGKPGDSGAGPLAPPQAGLRASSVTTCHLPTGNATFMPPAPASTGCLHTTCLSTLTLTLQPCSYLWTLPRDTSQSLPPPGLCPAPFWLQTPGCLSPPSPSVCWHTAPQGPTPSMQNQSRYHPYRPHLLPHTPTDSLPATGPRTFAHATLSAGMVFSSLQLLATLPSREPSLLTL